MRIVRASPAPIAPFSLENMFSNVCHGARGRNHEFSGASYRIDLACVVMHSRLLLFVLHCLLFNSITAHFENITYKHNHIS